MTSFNSALIYDASKHLAHRDERTLDEMQSQWDHWASSARPEDRTLVVAAIKGGLINNSQGDLLMQMSKDRTRFPEGFEAAVAELLAPSANVTAGPAMTRPAIGRSPSPAPAQPRQAAPAAGRVTAIASMQRELARAGLSSHDSATETDGRAAAANSMHRQLAQAGMAPAARRA